MKADNSDLITSHLVPSSVIGWLQLCFHSARQEFWLHARCSLQELIPVDRSFLFMVALRVPVLFCAFSDTMQHLSKVEVAEGDRILLVVERMTDGFNGKAPLIM
jgi:hypothetical protein